jgi:hypothetical protein
VQATSWWAQKEAAPRTNFEFCAVAAAARKLHPAAANAVTKSDRYDLPPQAKKVASDSVQWRGLTQSVEKEELEVLHRLVSAPDSTIPHHQVTI